MEPVTNAQRIGMPKATAEDLNAIEYKVKAARDILMKLEERGIRQCTEKENCDQILSEVHHMRNVLFGTPLPEEAKPNE